MCIAYAACRPLEQQRVRHQPLSAKSTFADSMQRQHRLIPHAAVKGDLCTLLRRQWQLEQLPLTTITPAAPRDCTMAADNNHPVWDALAGLAIGNIPPASVVISPVTGDPDTSVTRERQRPAPPTAPSHSRPCPANAGANALAEGTAIKKPHSNHPCCPRRPVATAAASCSHCRSREGPRRTGSTSSSSAFDYCR
jgi:hypothetical protein